ncbi:MAG TPA: glycosyltransferase [Phaeodactylibacter sp.]|nr:glycosyltransferase [Phaeodactylibacter sp.]
MKVSIITATYNRAQTLSDALGSVLEQDYPDIEHIVIDGASTDGTLALLEEYERPALRVYSAPDAGVFHALNKGLEMATGDIVGFLHSDDYFADRHIVSLVVDSMKTYGVDAVFGDALFVDREDTSKRKRYYSSKHFSLEKFAEGDMPAHTTFFTKREYYQRFGHFKTKYSIAADFDLLLRFLYTHRLSYKYLDTLMVYMRTGGLSNATWRQRYILNKEAMAVCRENGVPTSVFKIMKKLWRKAPGFFLRKGRDEKKVYMQREII